LSLFEWINNKFNEKKGQLSAILKAEKQTQGARVLKQDEKFGSDRIEEQKKEDVPLVRYPPGYIPPEPKKKKKRVKKKKEEDGNDQNHEADEKEENKP